MGATNGVQVCKFEVNESGGATYAMPITVSPGTAGIQPNLSVAYSSQGSNGLLGLGFSLGGLSIISRCPATRAQDNGLIAVDMGKFSIGNKDESSLFFEIYLNNDSEKMQGICIDLGNPHIVFFVDNVKDIDAIRTGKSIQESSIFPHSVNVGFCEIINSNEIELVVYERGSGLTLGCGSGACAATIAAIHLKKVENSLIKVNMPGGSIFTQSSDNNHVFLKGDASIVFEGVIDL